MTNVDLVLIRHAIAEERRAGLTEADRKLTDEGRQRFEELVPGYVRLGLYPTHIVSSPWKRAADTAALFRPYFTESTYTTLDALARPPDDSLVQRLAHTGNCAFIIGHEPWLSELCGFLTIGSSTSLTRLKKGGLIWLRGHPDAGGMLIKIMLAPALTLKLLDTQA